MDTNILAYLLIEGDRTEVCRRLLKRDPEWRAPFLWRSELRNVLATHMQHADMTLNGAQARMAQAETLLKGREHSVSSNVILELASSHPVSAYDAEFVCLADQLGTRLLTTDKPLLRKFPQIAVSPEEFLAAHGGEKTGDPEAG